MIPDRQTYSVRMPCGGIMLFTACGKLFHALLRKMLLPWTTRMCRPAQLGGFVDSKPTLLHICSALSVSMHRARMSFGVLFFDVKAAFHSMIREHAFGGSSLPQRLRDVL